MAILAVIFFFYAEPTVNNSEMLGPISSEREECQVDTSQKGQKENEAAIMCRDKSDGKIAVLSANGWPFIYFLLF
jgi:hypothetical protein